MRSSLWVLAPGTDRARADEIVAEVVARGLGAEARTVGEHLTIVVDGPPDDLQPPAEVVRAAAFEMPPEFRSTRRAFLDSFATALAVVVSGAAIGVCGAFGAPPEERGDEAHEVDVAGMGELKERGFKLFRFGREPGIVVLTNGKLYALSLVCTHLGCLVAWSPQRRQFLCPCHSASFDVGGNVLSGPPPRPLRSFDVSVQGERVLVRRHGGVTS